MIIENGKMVGGIIPKLVKKEGKLHFIDIDDSLSQPFASATVYAGGFAVVKTAENKPYKFRDMLGNVTTNKTQKGKDFFNFWMGKIGFEDLKVEYFADERFHKLVKLITSEKYKPLAQHFAQVCDAKRNDALAMLEEEKGI